MEHSQTHDDNVYFVPHGSRWPIFGSVSMFVTMFGVANWLSDVEWGKTVFFFGLAMMIATLFMWFRDVIRESLSKYYNSQVDISFRMGMMWFIFSEVMFFAAFFGALFYARMLSVPWLGGDGKGIATNNILWNGYDAAWPTNGPGNIGGHFETMSAWGIPLLNTLILLSSGMTITIAHHMLRAGRRGQLIFWLGATILLGATFLGFQAHEYIEAYTTKNLMLTSGVYGSTFFMLTGFHGMHVTLGAIMLSVIWLRCVSGHFTKDHHFAFEAVAWYWHFVDVVWLGLFVFVYVL